MSTAVVRFRSPRQPAHFVRAGRGYKFVGGRLAVAGPDAEAVRAYAAAHPSIGIVEDRPRRASPRPQPSEAEA
jgi:hypothetical protein